MILWLIIIIICIFIGFYFFKNRESFVIGNTNPDKNKNIIDISDTNILLKNYSSHFNFDELIEDVVRDNTYYNSLMFKNIDTDQLNNYISDMNLENKKLNEIKK